MVDQDQILAAQEDLVVVKDIVLLAQLKVQEILLLQNHLKVMMVDVELSLLQVDLVVVEVEH